MQQYSTLTDRVCERGALPDLFQPPPLAPHASTCSPAFARCHSQLPPRHFHFLSSFPALLILDLHHLHTSNPASVATYCAVQRATSHFNSPPPDFYRFAHKMATHRKHNSSAHGTSAATSNQYHNPAIVTLPQTNDPQQILAQTHPELVEAVLMLYDSHYSDEQFDEAFTRFAQNVEFMDPGLHLYNRLDMKAQFRYEQALNSAATAF